jgi:hypothetical protein
MEEAREDWDLRMFLGFVSRLGRAIQAEEQQEEVKEAQRSTKL